MSNINNEDTFKWKLKNEHEIEMCVETWWDIEYDIVKLYHILQNKKINPNDIQKITINIAIDKEDDEL